MKAMNSWTTGSRRSVHLIDPLQVFLNPARLLRRVATNIEVEGVPWVVAVEVAYQDGNLVISADVPGMSMEELKVEAIGNVLTIQGERKSVADRRPSRSERRYGKFLRQFVLPSGADVEHAQALLANGVLRIIIPLRGEQRDARVVP